MERIIKTGLNPNDKKVTDVLCSVLGQLSDGIWEENSYRYKDWYTNIDVNSDNTLNVKAFYRKSETEILSFFCRKIKAICLIELEDKYKEKIRTEMYEENGYGAIRHQLGIINLNELEENGLDLEKDFTKEGKIYYMNDDKYHLPSITSEEYPKFMAFQEEISRYIADHPFDKTGKFRADKSIKLDYLSYGKDKVTLADAVAVYDTLSNRIKELNKPNVDKSDICQPSVSQEDNDSLDER